MTNVGSEKYAPVVLFVYDRLDHARQTIEALQKNFLALESRLIIFTDAAKNNVQAGAVRAVRQYLYTIEGFKSVTVIEREENFGLARSIVDGVTSIISEYGRVIVLEDDLVTSPFFLQYMNDGLRQYEKDKNVASIHAYVYPIAGLPETFFMRGADCWGWATWCDRWAMYEPDGVALLSELKRRGLTTQFDLNGAYPFTQMLSDQISGRNNSWAIRWHASVFLKNKFTLYPGKSLVLNIGNDGSGENCGVTDKFSSDLAMRAVQLSDEVTVEENIYVFQMFEKYFNNPKIGFIEKMKSTIRKIFRGLA